MRRTRALWIVLIILLITGQACSLGGAPRGSGQPVIVPETGEEPSPQGTPLVLPPTEVPEPINTPAPPPTGTPEPSPTPPPPTATVVSEPVEAVITAERLNLRQGPGTFFDALGQVRKDTRVSVLGRSRGANWVYIDTGTERGWVAAAFTSLADTDLLAALEPVETEGVQIIQGQVLDRAGQPVPGVEFGIFQGDEDANPPTARAVTDAAGSFYIYLPAQAGGTWRLSLLGADCNSPAVDERCMISGALMPRFTDVTLPVEGVVEFLLER